MEIIARSVSSASVAVHYDGSTSHSHVTMTGGMGCMPVTFFNNDDKSYVPSKLTAGLSILLMSIFFAYGLLEFGERKPHAILGVVY